MDPRVFCISIIITLLLNCHSMRAEELQFLGEHPFRAYASRSTAAGQVLYQLFATSSTNGDSNGIMYSIEEMLTDESAIRFFSLNSSTGELILRQMFSSLLDYVIVVEVSSGSQAAVQANVTVTVVSESDTAPRYELESYNISISEDFPVGRAFSIVRAFSLPPSSTQNYAIIGGTSERNFEINSENGVLSLTRSLDRETVDMYSLILRYSCSDGYTDTLATVYILDVNDNAPQFTETLYEVLIPENTSNSTAVLTVSATDSDAGGSNSIVSYELSGGPPTSLPFFLDPQSGVLTTTSELDYERVNRYNLTIIARDGGIPPQSATTIVILNIANVDDECPRFENPLYIVEIPLDSPLEINQVILTVSATDPDQLGNISYSIVSSNDSNDVLSLNPATGDISLLASTAQTRGHYSLNISASDGSCVMTPFVQVEIGIGSENNFSRPMFDTPCVGFLPENSPLGTEIVTLSALDVDVGRNGIVRYSLVSTTLFSIDASSGVVCTARDAAEYDREIQDMYRVGVIARDERQGQDFCLLTVTLLDVNDNPPTFVSSRYDLTLPQNPPVNTSVIQMRAYDEDLGDNGTIIYALSPPQTSFSIDMNSGEVTTSASLNGSSQMEYTFNVTATDMGYPTSLSSSTSIRVTLFTGSSTLPVFLMSYYSAIICENAPVNFQVLEVNAAHGAQYEIIPGSDYSTNMEGTFTVVPSGAIIVGSRVLVDFERLGQRKSFQFPIRAYNEEGSSFAMVEILVTDINDNSIMMDEVASFSLAENQPVGTTVIQVLAYDLDSGSNGDIVYSQENDLPQYFSISQNGTIVSTHVFDFDNSSEELSGTLRVNAYNPNPPATNKDLMDMCIFIPFAPPNSSIIDIMWVILDQSDVPPSFSQQMYTISLSEDHPIESTVFTFNASDSDTSDRNHLSFIIREGNDGSFAIESDTLLLVRRLDYELKMNYTLRVEVTDGVHSDPACTQCSATITISITNVDDEPPVFSASSYYGEVEESAPIGTTVLTLLARDPDSASIGYRLLGPSEGRFGVSGSGVVTVSGLLDREEFPDGVVTFLAIAEAGGVDVAEVNITLLDVNDHAPRFLDIFSGRVHENVLPTEEGIFVVQVRASDSDQGRNGTVTYTLVDGIENRFRIDPSSGVLTAHAKYDREVQPSYNLIVQVTDDGIPTNLSTTTLVTVTIGDDNDNRPFFPYPFMFARIFENAPVGSHVFNVPALDPDNGTNSNINYTLISSTPPDKFELDPSTGEVRVLGSLDYEVPTYRHTMLTIRISEPLFQGEMDGMLSIMLLDRNDNPPRVDPPSYTLGSADNIPENLPAGLVLATITAFDEDDGSNGEIDFSIVSGNDRGDFEISNTGSVRNLVVLDYEAVDMYALMISVSDRGMPPQSTLVELDFNILDVNDNPPSFSQEIYTVSVMENQPPMLSILRVTATDPDSGNGGMVRSYNIISGDGEMRFDLNSTTGILRTNVIFDREDVSCYNLIITANDRGADSHTGTGMVQVTISDVNDTPSENGGLLQVYIYARDGIISSPRVIGPAYFSDPDTSDTFTGCIASGMNTRVFSVSEVGCNISLDTDNPPIIPATGHLLYTMTVQGNDGEHATVSAGVAILVDHISSADIPNDGVVTITINATDIEYFTEGLNISIPSLIAQNLGVQRSNLYIVSVQHGYHDPVNTLDMTLSARRTSGEHMSTIEIINALFLARNELFVGLHGVVSIPTDPCVTEPCFNQAECRSVRVIGDTERTILTRQYILFAPVVSLSYECDCVPGTAGELCEINYDDCYSNPCFHGVECTDAVQGFICDCPDGTSGSDCSFNPDECLKNPCQNSAKCINGFGTYVCECLPGFYGHECQYAHFQISSICDSVSCQNGATCSPGRDSFTCLCPSVGFSGVYCEKPVVIRGGCLRNPCHNGSSCTDTDAGPICHCSAGFTGPFCRWPLNNCELEPCENRGTCEEGLYGSYVCTCAAGYTGTNCTSRTPACESSPCMNGGWCTENVQDNSFICQCTRLFSGPLCEVALIPVDLCDELLLCSSPSNCTSGGDGFTCSCDPEYSGFDCSMPSDMSTSSCSSNPCLHGGSCTPTGDNDGYICQCSNGFTGLKCETNVDDCSTDPCVNGSTCQDGIGGYICNCTEGVTGNTCEVFCPAGQEGEFCEETILYCSPSSCMNDGTCVEVTGAYACQCPETHTGARCELNNSCTLTRCLNGGTCTNAPPSGVPSCNCMPGFDGSDNCKLFTASFSGSLGVNSFRTFRPLQLEGQGEVTLEFATRSQEGLLLYSTQYQGGVSLDLIALEVVGGYLKMSVSHGSGAGSAVVMSSSVSVDDGRWHQVALQTSGKSFSVLLDQCQILEEGLLALANCRSSAVTPGKNSFLNIGLPLWIGGVPFNIPNNNNNTTTPSTSSSTSSQYHITNVGFTGCIRNVTINGELLDLEDYVDERNSERGCLQIESSCDDVADGGRQCGVGSCQPSYGDFRCICPPQIAGDRCEKAAEILMFNEEGYAQYSLIDTTEIIRSKRQTSSVLRSTLTDQISLRFRTELDRGILFQIGETNGTGDFSFLQLQNGGVVAYHINLGSGKEIVDLPTSFSSVNNAEWHYLEVERTALDLRITLDNLTFSHTLGGNQLYLDVEYDQFYAGGSPVQTGIGRSYTGCLEDIRVDQNILPTSGSNRFSTVTFRGDTIVTTRCGLKGCFPDPCQGGNCTESGDMDFICSCRDGSILNSSPCINQASVIRFLLVIIIIVLLGLLLLLVLIGVILMVCWKRRANHKFDLVHSSNVTPTPSEIILSTRDCVVITNDAGGGEEDTNMTDANWKRSCNLPRKESLRVSSSSSSSSLASSLHSINEPLTRDEPKGQKYEINPLPSQGRAQSPVISAFIDKRLESLRNEYRDLDSVREFEDEGDYLSNVSLDSTCSYILDEEEYTVERLKKAGPEFQKFVGVYEALTVEEDNDIDLESRIVHTGQTQTETGTQSQGGGGFYF